MTGRQENRHSDSRYRTIVADPPWHYSGTTGVNRGARAGQRAPVLPYATMSVEEIAALPVERMAETDAHLLLWTTNRYLEDSYAVARAWGFRPAQILTWCKPLVGIGPGGVIDPSTPPRRMEPLPSWHPYAKEIA